MTAFLKPRSLSECVDRLRDRAFEGARLMAGGTDLMLELRDRSRAREISAVVDIWDLEELRGVSDDGDALRIGALTTFAELIVNPLVQRDAKLLADVSRDIGGIQIQNRGTIGGNLATGSPAGDSLPILLALDADVVLLSAGGERRVPATRFYAGYRRNVMRPGELITAVRIPRREPPNFTFYRKVATRRAQAISKVLVAMRGERRPDGRFASIAIAFGSVAATPVRASQTEAFITSHDGPWNADSFARLNEQLLRDIHPIDDLRSTARYRSTVSFNLLRRALTS
jgi:xanthine dehydrogenase small subunit